MLIGLVPSSPHFGSGYIVRDTGQKRNIICPKECRMSALSEEVISHPLKNENTNPECSRKLINLPDKLSSRYQ